MDKLKQVMPHMESGKTLCVVRWSFWANDEFEWKGSALVNQLKLLGVVKKAQELDDEVEIRSYLKPKEEDDDEDYGLELVPIIHIGGNVSHEFSSFADMVGSVSMTVPVHQDDEERVRMIVSHGDCEIIDRINGLHSQIGSI